jgi:hypothetical protein
MSRLQHFYIGRPGDKERIIEGIRSFMEEDDAALIESYNHQAKLGIVGVHAQGLQLLAMRQVFLKRFGKSPVELFQGRIIRLKGMIAQQENGFYYTKSFHYAD